MSRVVRLLLAVAAALTLAACGDLFNPLETDPNEAGIDLRVVGCEYDTTSTVAKAIFELSSAEKEYATILVNGELSDESGVVIATSSTSVNGVEPGKTYRKELVFGGLSSEPQGELVCDVSFDFASGGFGGG
jgi:hypothetical protein